MSKLNVISISDIHTGHNRVKADIIHLNLERILYPLLNDDLDLLIIGGDFFDTLLDMNGQAGFHAACIIDEIKALALKHRFFIRVIRGTFSHDRLQNQFFTKDVRALTINGEAITKLADKVAVERIETLGLTLLYVPDDLPYDDPMEVIRQKLEDSHAGQADIAVVHSYFRHLLPPGIPREPHNTYTVEQFKPLVRGVVLNGHIHTSAVYDNVITNGSFERLAHGEEEPKGFFSIRYDTDSGKAKHMFHENVHATTFKTLDMSGVDVGSALKQYPERVNMILDQSTSSNPLHFIRVITDDPVVKQALLEFSKKTYQNVSISFKQSKTTGCNEEEIITSVVDLPVITPENLAELASDHLAREHGIKMPPETIQRIMTNAA